MIRRDPTDERLRRRLATGYILSLVIHALAALVFFSIVTSSSEQSAQEAIEGAPALSITHVRAATPQLHPRFPVTHARKTAPVRARPAIAGHRPVIHRRELAKQNPSAPPNPTPVPSAPASPSPELSTVALATVAPMQTPSVPMQAASAPPAAAQTPRPTAKPTAAPVPAATPRPATASPVPSAVPSAAPTRAPLPTAGPVARATPLAARGLPTAAPSGRPSPSVQRGASATAGPKRSPTSGALPVKASARPQPPRPIQVLPTPSPFPTRSPRPRRSSGPLKQAAYNHLLDRLKGALPNGPVTPTTKRYAPSSYAKPGDPTPPPEIVAKTKFLYTSTRSREDRVLMYVTAAKRHGLLSTCTGWLVRYPSRGPAYGSLDQAGKLVLTNPGPASENSFMPIVEENVTTLCETSRLQPYVPPPAPSPRP